MDQARAKKLLAAERARIQRELRALAAQPTDEPTADQHLADLGSDLYEAELDEGLAEELQDQLAALERAEQRLQEGTYGLSVESGEPIPDGRLEAYPLAERTTAEQERFDRG